MKNIDVKVRLEAAIQKTVQSGINQLSNSNQVANHVSQAAKYAGKGISQWAQDNPKVATALAAGSAGLALGKRLSRKG